MVAQPEKVCKAGIQLDMSDFKHVLTTTISQFLTNDRCVITWMIATQVWKTMDQIIFLDINNYINKSMTKKK